MPLPVIFLGSIVLFLLLAAAALKAFAGDLAAKRGVPYEKEDNLFTPTEREFLVALEAAVAGQFRIFGKVRLADVIRTKRGLDNATRQSAFNRIQSKHLDFVVCDPTDLSVQFAIELDDSSHAKPSRQNRDAFVDHALEAASVPLFRFPAKRSYSAADIHRQIFDTGTTS